MPYVVKFAYFLVVGVVAHCNAMLEFRQTLVFAVLLFSLFFGDRLVFGRVCLVMYVVSLSVDGNM